MDSTGIQFNNEAAKATFNKLEANIKRQESIIRARYKLIARDMTKLSNDNLTQSEIRNKICDVHHSLDPASRA